MEVDVSIAGIASSALSHLTSLQHNYQQVRSEFKQLGQDLQAGDLTKAQSDFVTLSQSMASQLASNSPVAKPGPAAVTHHNHVPAASVSQQLSQLGQALQAGNLAAAQQAFAAVQQSWEQTSSSPLTGSAASSGISVKV